MNPFYRERSTKRDFITFIYMINLFFLDFITIIISVLLLDFYNYYYLFF